MKNPLGDSKKNRWRYYKPVDPTTIDNKAHTKNEDDAVPIPRRTTKRHHEASATCRMPKGLKNLSRTYSYSRIYHRRSMKAYTKGIRNRLSADNEWRRIGWNPRPIKKNTKNVVPIHQRITLREEEASNEEDRRQVVKAYRIKSLWASTNRSPNTIQVQVVSLSQVFNKWSQCPKGIFRYSLTSPCLRHQNFLLLPQLFNRFPCKQ